MGNPTKILPAAALILATLAPQAEASWFGLPRVLKSQVSLAAVQTSAVLPVAILQQDNTEFGLCRESEHGATVAGSLAAQFDAPSPEFPL